MRLLAVALVLLTASATSCNIEPTQQQAGAVTTAFRTVWVAETEGLLRLDGRTGAILQNLPEVAACLGSCESTCVGCTEAAPCTRGRRVLALGAKEDIFSYGHRTIKRHGLDGADAVCNEVPHLGMAEVGAGPGPAALRVRMVVEPVSGTLWVGLSSRVDRVLVQVNPDALPLTLAVILLPEDTAVMGLAIDRGRNLLWVASSREASAYDAQAVLLGCQPEQPCVPPAPLVTLPIEAGTTITDLFFDEAADQLWLTLDASGTGSVRRFAGNGQDLLSSATVPWRPERVVADGQGAWVTTSTEVFRFGSDGQPAGAAVPTGSDTAPIRALAVDDAGAAWVGRQSAVHQLSPGGTVVSTTAMPVGVEVNDLIIISGEDRTRPQLRFVYPEPGATVDTRRPLLHLEHSDVGSGVDPSTVRITANGRAVALSCNDTSDRSFCTPIEDLAEGANELVATVTDRVGNVSAPAMLHINVDTSRTSPEALEQQLGVMEREALDLRYTVALVDGEIDRLRADEIFWAAFGGHPPGDPSFRGQLTSTQAHRERLARRLAQLDAQMDKALDSAYVHLSSDVRRAYRQLTRLALLEWASLFRRLAASRLGTQAAGMRHFATCRWDLVDQHLLWQYFRTVTSTALGPRERAESVKILRSFRDALACLDKQMLLYADGFIVETFERLRQRLAERGLEALLHGVIDAAAPLMLISFDAAKSMGRTAPAPASFRWWQTYEGLVRAGLAVESSAFSWLGVWVTDPKTNNLIGIPSTCADKPLGSLCVDAQLFVESISKPVTLGHGDCSFYDMIRRGDSQKGFLCLGGACADAIAGCEPDDPACRYQNIGCAFGDSTKFGASCSDVQVACSTGNQPFGGGGGGDRGQFCGLGGVVADSLLGCVMASQRQQIYGYMECLSEAADFCASPIDRLVKEATLQQLATANAGPACRFISAERDTGTGNEGFTWREIISLCLFGGGGDGVSCELFGGNGGDGNVAMGLGGQGAPQPQSPPAEGEHTGEDRDGSKPPGYDATVNEAERFWNRGIGEVVRRRLNDVYRNNLRRPIGQREFESLARSAWRAFRRLNTYNVRGLPRGGRWATYLLTTSGAAYVRSDRFGDYLVFSAPVWDAATGIDAFADLRNLTTGQIVRFLGARGAAFVRVSGRGNGASILHEFVHFLTSMVSGLKATEAGDHLVTNPLGFDCGADALHCDSGCTGFGESVASQRDCVAVAQPDVPPPSNAMPENPEDINAPEWAACFDQLTLEEANFQSACTRVQCDFPKECNPFSGTCSDPGSFSAGSGLDAHCGAVDCAEGRSSLVGFGQCRCGSQLYSAFLPGEL